VDVLAVDAAVEPWSQERRPSRPAGIAKLRFPS
jgi:hypothetical protein